MKKIAIYGGTFNPVHNEHINLIKNAIDELSLDLLIVVPTNITPNKTTKVICGEDRFNMLKLSLSNIEKVSVSDYELKNEGKSYTYLTVKYFKEMYPNDQLFFIMGADMLKDFRTWKNPKDIVKYAKIVVFDRQGTFCDFNKESKYFNDTFNDNFIKLNYCGKDFSSTKIRVYSKLSLDITPFTPKSVADYIKDKNIYPDDKYSLFIKKNLKESRIIHTAGVIIKAMEKDRELNLDGEKVYLSALLHDCAKYLKKEDYPDANISSDVPSPVVHAFLGAYIAENVLKVNDDEIIDAIRYHTSGKANMTTLGKLIFVADMIEDNRNYLGVEKLREIYKKSLDECFVECLKEEMVHLLNRGDDIYFETVNAYNYYVLNKNN